MCALETTEMKFTRKPMFVTFYSYKGGVGRTLALANIATLLARDKSEPCRVLVWDFDLPAPGLQDVVKCKWTDEKVGFVDYLDSYLRTARLDDIKKYIHQTSIPGVDILPAGFMGREYAQRLEEVQWQEVYQEARGFQFIAHTKSQISQLQPSYDYVLIDSLTGYSDVGGICVNQLADAVVLIFRLNRQNIEGISKVYRSIREYAKNNGVTSQLDNIVPVISPAWPFAASESNVWFEKAKKVFGSRRIFTLSFEGSMMLGEKILCAATEKYAIEPPILRDYRALTDHLRGLNLQDPKTMYKRATNLREQNQFSDAIELFGNLIERRPDVERYWRELTTSVQTTPTGAQKRILPQVTDIIRRGCDAQKPWAYVAKAWQAETIEQDWKVAHEEFGRAIALDPKNGNLYFFRGLSQMNHEEYLGATADFSKSLELNLRGTRVAMAYFNLGNSYRNLNQPRKAIGYFSEAITRQPNDVGFLNFRALTLYSAGKYSDAARDLETAVKIDPSRVSVKILSAHIAAALGNKDEARRILEGVRTQAELMPTTFFSLVEAYVVISPAETVRILEANPELTRENDPVAQFLKTFASILLRTDAELEPSAPSNGGSANVPISELWEITELKEFLKWGSTTGQLTEMQHAALSMLMGDPGLPRADDI
jgi:tetratricopeptide (TPR) repeat protein